MSAPIPLSFPEYAAVLRRIRDLDREVADDERAIRGHRATMEMIASRFGFTRNPDDPDDDPVARFRASGEF